MDERLAPVLALLLGLTMVTVGCVETIPGSQLVGIAHEDEAAASEQALEHAGADRSEFVALSIVMRLGDHSNLLLPVEAVELTPEPAGTSAFVTNLSRLSVGQTKGLGALAVEAGAQVPAQELRVTVYDGIGRSELAVDIQPWTAVEDRRLVLTVTVLAPGEVALTSLSSDVPATAQSDQATPLYGALVYPDGTRRAVDGVDTLVRVPSDHPRYHPGQTVSYKMPGAPADTVWSLDGQELGTGPEVTWVTQRGEHVLEARLPGTEQVLQLKVFVDQELTYQGTVQAGTGPIQENVADRNGKAYKLDLGEGAAKVLGLLRPVDAVGDMQDLDIYLVSPNGTTIAQSAREGHSIEEMLATGDLPAGEYTLWVHGVTGVEMEHILEVSVRY